jgi:NAD(P)-dependent dehydrogenase (short-subunit alcohol dehydrogenase family)
MSRISHSATLGMPETGRSVPRRPLTGLVTGANQGLGRALVAGLAARMAPEDRILLTGRDPRRVQAAADALGANVEGRVLDVRDGAAIEALAAELGEVDIVFSNAGARISPDGDPAADVDAVAETSNLATTRVLRAFGPRMRPGGRLIVVASALGTLDQLDVRAADRFARAADDGLDAVDALVEDWRRAVHEGYAEAEGYGSWLNIPSKVAQVAAVRAAAREYDQALVMALCPGLIDTGASRPWFADMSDAQTPEEAAAWPVELALAERYDPAFGGELVQFGKVLPWATRTRSAAR